MLVLCQKLHFVNRPMTDQIFVVTYPPSEIPAPRSGLPKLEAIEPPLLVERITIDITN